MRSMMIAALVLFGSSSLAADAKVTQKFRVAVPRKKLAAWVTAHQKTIAESLRVEVVSRTPAGVRVRMETPIGVQEFTIADTSWENDHSTTFASTLATNHRGDTKRYHHTITLQDTPKGTEVAIEVAAGIDDDRVTEFDLRSILEVSLESMVDLFKTAFP